MTTAHPRHLHVVEDVPAPTPLPHTEPSSPTPTQSPTLKVVPEHKVTIRLLYIDYSETGGGRSTFERTDTPYKWRGECTCGWGCISWSWWRERDVLKSGLTRVQWIEENGEPEGGTLVMALDHIADKATLPATTTAN